MKLIFILLLFLMSAVCFAEIKTVEYTDVVYKHTPQRDLMLDIKYVENGVKKPVIFLIHGGGWTGGTKESMENFGFPFFAEIYKKGYVVVSVQYRFIQESPFPACIEDCKSAVGFLRANADRYEINPDIFIAGGHSAGGHLASMLGVLSDDYYRDKNYSRFSSKVQGVIDMSGPVNFEMKGDPLGEAYSANIKAWLCGNNPLLYKLSDPINHIDRNAADFLIFQGAADEIVYYKQCDDFVKKLKDNNVYCDYVLTEGGGHVYDFGQYTDKVMAFLDRVSKK